MYMYIVHVASDTFMPVYMYILVLCIYMFILVNLKCINMYYGMYMYIPLACSYGYVPFSKLGPVTPAPVQVGRIQVPA